MSGTTEAATRTAASSSTEAPQQVAAVRFRRVSCRLGRETVLHDIDLTVAAGEVHGLIGPNGAGKTTLLRLAAGLAAPSAGLVEVTGRRADLTRDVAYRRAIGYVPSGARTFYQRLSGRENLVFFARLGGLSHRSAASRADRLLVEVGLGHAGRRRVGTYSQGMNRRLAVARALLTAPAVLLVDEATHDLDPEGGDRLRALVSTAARSHGAGVLWATQRLEELVGFADTVTVLVEGRVHYDGGVAELTDDVGRQRFVVRIRDGKAPTKDTRRALQRMLADTASIAATDQPEHYLLEPGDGRQLGEALARVTAGGYDVFSCREERPAIEVALRGIQRDSRAVAR